MFSYALILTPLLVPGLGSPVPRKSDHHACPSDTTSRQSPMLLQTSLPDSTAKVLNSRTAGQQDDGLQKTGVSLAAWQTNEWFSKQKAGAKHSGKRSGRHNAGAKHSGKRSSKRIAVFVAGGLVRYEPESSAEHFVSPLVKQGHQVDYYISLVTGTIQSFTPASNQYLMHPNISNCSEGYETAIRQPLEQAGATVRHLGLPTEEDENKMNDAEEAFANASTDMAAMLFPTYDDKQKQACRNVVRRYRRLQALWKEAAAFEESDGKQYDLMVVLMDDATWAYDFDLEALVQTEALPENEGKNAYSLFCEEGSTYYTGNRSFNDFIWILERNAAEPFLTAYNHLIKPEDHGLTIGADGMNVNIVYNIESFVKYVADKKGIKMAQSNWTNIPVARIDRVKDEDNDIPMVDCMHYLCTSRKDWSDTGPYWGHMGRCDWYYHAE